MKRVLNIIFLLSIFFYGFSNVVVSEDIKIAVISDVHFLSKKLIIPGKALSVYENSTGRNIEDLHSVLNLVLNNLLEEEIDVLLITGDLTNHGERQSHIDFIEKLKPLKEAGTCIFVTPGNHDINIPNSKQYIGDEATTVASVTVNEFEQLYDSLSFGNILSKDESSLSYAAELNKDTWLLSLDTNRYDENVNNSITGGRIRNETMIWALQILQEAQVKGIRVLGIMHHGLVEHMPFQSAFFSDYLVEDWKNKADSLADAGLNIIFTGHFHSNDITLHKSPSGNILYDIETASLSQYPFAYRIMNLSDSSLYIDTRFVTSTASNPNLESEYRNKLEVITNRVAENRINNLGVPMPPNIKGILREMIVNLYMAHVKGDEVPDSEMIEMIESFSSLLGNEVQEKDYVFDFPPEDNKLIIEFETFNR
ncbi:MAG: metallophosphoesterase [Fermentimonas sp.]|nr:metallophosphoesterase [Fermentimonas sp.]